MIDDGKLIYEESYYGWDLRVYLHDTHYTWSYGRGERHKGTFKKYFLLVDALEECRAFSDRDYEELF